MKKEKEKKIEELDEETVVVSMEGIEAPSLFGRNRRAEEYKTEKAKEENDDRPWENNSFTKEEKRYALRGALGASLLIWLVYAVAFGIVILIMVLLSKRLGL